MHYVLYGNRTWLFETEVSKLSTKIYGKIQNYIIPPWPYNTPEEETNEI